jgi:hypothetical protein
MAFGMPSATDSYQHHAVSRTHYAFWKRKMERSAHKLGTRSQISVFRLGQVHGELQTVTRETATRIRAAAGPLCVTNSESDIVLASTIALALRATHCDEGEPGDYSLVDVPAWRLDEFYRFAAAELDSDVEIETVPAGKSGSALRFVSDWIGSNREAMVSHLLPRSAAIEWRAKANWALKRTRAELAQLRPVITARTGPVPGARLALSATRDDAVRLLRATRARIHRAFGHGGHVFRLAAGALPVEPPREPREIRG